MEYLYRNTKRIVYVSSLALAMVGCTGLDTKGSNKDETVENSVSSKIEKVTHQQEQIDVLIQKGDSALKASNFLMAESIFNDVLEISPDNLRALEGLYRLELYRSHESELEKAISLLDQGSESSNAEASLLLRGILVENPQNSRARSIYNDFLIKKENKRLQSMAASIKYTQPVTLEFRNTELSIVIEALSKGTKVNFMLDNDVKKNTKVSIFVKNITLESAIEMLVQSNGLRKKILGDDSILLYPDTPQKIRQYQDLIIRSFYLEYADPNQVSNLLKTMLGIKQVQIDERLPMIMIKDVPEVMTLAEKLIESQDIPEPEVMLEMEILEVRKTALTDVGIIWPNQVSVLSPTAGLTLEALKNVDSSTIGISPNPNVTFANSDSQVNLLANPRIRVKNKEQAKIHIGDRVPVITSNVSSNGVISDNVQYIDTGLKLDVQPEISRAGDVTIKLNLDVSSIGEKVTTSTGALVPQIGTRSTSTELRLKDGETQVLAGLISDEDRETVDKLPGLGNIPVIGKLFSSENKDKLKTELVLSITPRIIRARKAISSEQAEYWSGTELNAGRAMAGPTRTKEEISKLFRAGTPDRKSVV